MINITLYQMEEYCTIVRFQNITKAAEFLYTSQPSLSRHLTELETELGLQLLVRGSSRVFALTKAGKLLYDEAVKILNSVSDMTSRVKWLGCCCGNLVISSTNFYYRPFFDACARFNAGYPDISFSIYYSGNTSTCQAVLQGKADIGVGFSYEIAEFYSDISTYKLFEDCFCAIISENHPLANQDSISINDIKDETFLYIDSSYGDITEKTTTVAKDLNDVLFKLKNKTVNCMESLFLQIRAGSGICVLPRVLAWEYRSGCKILELEGQSINYDVILMWKSNTENPAVRLFLSEVENIISPEN